MSTHRPVIHDVVAIGLGPFNLGLACLLEPIDELDAVFVESEHDVAWHPGMLLEHSTVQTPFLADLVTLADPTSSFSFLNFLKETGRLYPFSIRGVTPPSPADLAVCRPGDRFGERRPAPVAAQGWPMTGYESSRCGAQPGTIGGELRQIGPLTGTRADGRGREEAWVMR